MIFLTGSGGFIGKNLKEYLETKFDVLAPRSSQLNLLNYEDTERFFKLNKIRAVIHCASHSVKTTTNSSEDITLQNIAMFQNIVKAASDNALIINMGSGGEYDKSRELKKVREHEFGHSIPNDPYGYSKYLISKEIEKYPNALNLRLFGVFGPHEHYSRFPSYAIIQNLKKEPIIINNNTIFSYLFIEDLCKIVEYFLNSPPKTRFLNVVPSETITMLQISDIVNKISPFKSSVIIKNEKLGNEYSGDNGALLSEIRDFNFTPNKTALANFFEYFLRMRI
ncbi:MAG: NAD(P)-dependent oxidoreductase [Holosporaceae bacterium]|jgi:GDP-L-fucose synthase|nr:NAD(P)-dependent oxidoreductase [Holosporaceae bacterium]